MPEGSADSEKLVVKNFGPIKDADLLLNRYMVFIGKQASGKSTIAKLLAIFRNINFVMIEDANSHSNYFKDYNLSSYFTKGTVLQYYNAEYVIVYSNNNWKITRTPELDARIAGEKSRINEIFRTVINSNDIYKKMLDAEKESLIAQSYENSWRSMIRVLKDQIYIPAERILVSTVESAPFSMSKLALPNCLNEFITRFEIARSQIKEQALGFLPIVYKFENNQNRIYYDSTHFLLLSEGASGLQSLIPMQLVVNLVVEGYKAVALIVEEPELNLFPTTQRDVIHFLVSSSNRIRESDLVITTHSPYVLSVFNNLLFSHMVSKKNLNHQDEVEKIVRKDIQIDPTLFNAYYMSGGEIQQIFDTTTGLISQNDLDNVSEDLQGEFDELMEIYKRS